MSNPTRISLLEELKHSGAEAAWREFCGIYERLIRQWLRRESLQECDIDDVTQDVLTALVTAVPTFCHNGRVGAFRCWLRRLVSNRLRRSWESKSREQRALAGVDLADLSDQLADDTSHLSSIWDLEHDQFVLRSLLKTLRTRFAKQSLDAFERISIDRESAQSVAKDLGMTLGAVRVAQHRVSKALREISGDLVS
ncbi:MAG: sigma-70 family RNA polymerase sigma factor [Planctomycetota bacterium]